jgi:hypothetical protein
MICEPPNNYSILICDILSTKNSYFYLYDSSLSIQYSKENETAFKNMVNLKSLVEIVYIKYSFVYYFWEASICI